MGSGDIFGMPVAHAVASGMNGMRAAGDLVARLEMAKGMRLADAKRYVAGKLGDECRGPRRPARDARGPRRAPPRARLYEVETTYPDDPSPLEAKRAIARLLGLPAPGWRG